MLSISDYVFYGTTGVCQITDIRAEKFGDADEQDYYVLSSLNTKSLTYVSTINKAHLSRMRKLLTEEEILELIRKMPDEKYVWPKNDRERNDMFSAKLGSADCQELACMIKGLYLEGERRKKAGKRLNSADTRTMSIAERLLHEEFAFVLGIEPNEVVSFIQKHIPEAPLAS